VFVDFSDNNLSEEGISTALSSYTSSSAALTLDFTRNNARSLPAGLLANVGSQLSAGANITLRLRENPIAVINESVFVSPIYTGYITYLSIDIGSATTRHVQVPSASRFVVDNIVWVPVGFGNVGGATITAPPTLTINAANTSIDISIAQALSAFSASHYTASAALVITIDLSLNNYTEIAEGAFSNPMLQSINLSFNNISRVSNGAFSNASALQTVDLSSNVIDSLSDSAFLNTSFLKCVDVSYNRLTFVGLGMHLAVPFARFNLSNNLIDRFPRQIDPAIIVKNNPLSCPPISLQSYNEPTTDGCSCNLSGMTPVLMKCFSFVLCVNNSEKSSYGCEPGSFFNSTNCSDAPFPSCIKRIPLGQYYDESMNTFQPISVCSQTFNSSNGYLRAYQFQAPTATTNRLCSICSSCPSGYKTVQCTDTANTQCTNERGWITTVIVVCTVVPVVVLSITFLYIFKKRALDETTTNLELTERLLDGQRDENELMGQAWSIAEEDLTFGKLIGEGAFGRVWDGTWGHVPVAIKVLRIPFDELDLDMQEDFDREVSSPCTCTRHSNVLGFFGAVSPHKIQNYLSFYPHSAYILLACRTLPLRSKCLDRSDTHTCSRSTVRASTATTGRFSLLSS
jgi:hypothetical protein